MLENKVAEWVTRDRDHQFTWRGDLEYRRSFYSGLVDLVHAVDRHEDLVMVEIGTLLGESTELFAMLFKEVHTVDPYVEWEKVYVPKRGWVTLPEIEGIFVEGVLSKYSNIKKVKLPSVVASEQYPDKSLSFVYIDAGHEFFQVNEDVEAWLPKVATGGYLGGHDFDLKRFPGVVQSVEDHFGKKYSLFKDTSWLVKL